MSYQFPPRPKTSTRFEINHVTAVVIFREATGCMLSEASHWIRLNLGETHAHDAHEVGRLIKAYHAK